MMARVVHPIHAVPRVVPLRAQDRRHCLARRPHAPVLREPLLRRGRPGPPGLRAPGHAGGEVGRAQPGKGKVDSHVSL